MTDKQITSSIKVKKLKLSFGDMFTHYAFPALLFGLSLIPAYLHLKYYLEGNPESFKHWEIWFIVVPLILGTIFYTLQSKSLNFKIVNTSLPRKKVDEVIRKVAKELEWNIISKNTKAIVATTNPPFTSGSWGERITILFDGDVVLINSICDPGKQSSVVSMGRNKKNTIRLIEEIKNC